MLSLGMSENTNIDDKCDLKTWKKKHCWRTCKSVHQRVMEKASVYDASYFDYMMCVAALCCVGWLWSLGQQMHTDRISKLWPGKDVSFMGEWTQYC